MGDPVRDVGMGWMVDVMGVEVGGREILPCHFRQQQLGSDRSDRVVFLGGTISRLAFGVVGSSSYAR